MGIARHWPCTIGNIHYNFDLINSLWKWGSNFALYVLDLVKYYAIGKIIIVGNDQCRHTAFPLIDPNTIPNPNDVCFLSKQVTIDKEYIVTHIKDNLKNPSLSLLFEARLISDKNATAPDVPETTKARKRTFPSVGNNYQGSLTISLHLCNFWMFLYRIRAKYFILDCLGDVNRPKYNLPNRMLCWI